MTAETPWLVVFVLPDARRLGFQLRMNRGGAYLEQVRLAVTVVQERVEAEADGHLEDVARLAADIVDGGARPPRV